ncbi:MAG: hypothetical protein WBG71_00350 [Leeuwenhoekiella sp.]
MFLHIQSLKSSIVSATIVLSLIVSQYTFAQDTSETKPEVGTTQKVGDAILFALPTATLATSFIIGDEQGAW